MTRLVVHKKNVNISQSRLKTFNLCFKVDERKESRWSDFSELFLQSLCSCRAIAPPEEVKRPELSTTPASTMSKFDVSDFDADELNQGIDDTNFPNSRHASVSNLTNENHNGNDEHEREGPSRIKSPAKPIPAKPNGFVKSFDDEVFDVIETPKTPRSIPTPGNCEWIPIFGVFLVIAQNTYTSTMTNHDLVRVVNWQTRKSS